MFRSRPTMLEVFRDRAREDADRIAMLEITAGGSSEDRHLSWREWHDASRAVGAALLQAGVAPGDRVAILAGNRMLWPVADLGILMAGATSVGIYPTSAPSQVVHLLRNCGASVAIADTGEQLEKIRRAGDALPRLRTIVCEDEEAAARAGVASWAAWIAAGAGMLESRSVAAELDRRAAAVGPGTDALLVYTSGSTGEPKGARLTHRYLHASAESVRDALGLAADDSALSFLPYCHAGERVFGLYTRILCGIQTAHVEDQSRLWSAARAFKSTIFGGLPRYFEKLHEALMSHEQRLDGEDRRQWVRALALGRERSALRRRGAAVPGDLESAWRTAAAPCTKVLSSYVGSRVRIATSGGATLRPDVADYLDAAGLTVYGAYGQTEHLCIAMHRPSGYDTETVGPPMPGTEVRIADDGELLVRRGALTFSGYFGMPDESTDAFTPDGEWLRTGDVAAMTPAGRLRITGRKKEIIALSNGKKVSPLPIESALTQDPLIAHAMLYGEGKNFITALLIPDRTAVEAWMRGRPNAAGYDDTLRDPDFAARIQQLVDTVNSGLSRPEQVRRWAILGHDLAADHDELTPTLKVRRSVVTERYRVLLEPFYA